MHRPSLFSTHFRAVCAARGLSAGDEAAWQAFVASVAGAELTPDALAALADPDATCPF